MKPGARPSAMSQTPSPLSGRPLDRTYVPTTGVPARLVLPEPDCFTLSCGAAVRLLERHDLPVVAVEALLPGGAGATPVAHAGLATLTADMLDEGAGGRSALALARTLEGLGAGFDSVAGYEDSRVRLWVLSPRLPEALSVMADVLMRPTLASDELDRVRCERMDTVLQLRDEPGSLAGDALASLLYGPGHPWGQSLLGTRASLGGITRDDVVRYHAGALPTGEHHVRSCGRRDRKRYCGSCLRRGSPVGRGDRIERHRVCGSRAGRHRRTRPGSAAGSTVRGSCGPDQRGPAALRTISRSWHSIPSWAVRSRAASTPGSGKRRASRTAHTRPSICGGHQDPSLPGQPCTLR